MYLFHILKEETLASWCSNSMHSFLDLCLGCLPEIYFLCLQVETISDILLSKQLFFSFKILSFFSKQKLHLLDPPGTFFIIDHFMAKSVLLCFKCHKRVSKVPFRLNTSIIAGAQ